MKCGKTIHIKKPLQRQYRKDEVIMKKYMVYMDDGRDCFKVAVPANNEKAARKYVEGNGEVISVKDVTKETGSGFYNLNTVNSFHSFIKRQYEFYRRVATKYLNRYNALFSAAYKCTEAGLRQLMFSLLTVSGTRRSPSCRDIETAGLLLI